MLVKLNKEALLTAKMSDGKLIVLVPGYNDFDDEIWKDARMSLMDKINMGVVEEEWVKINPDMKDSYAFIKNDEKAMYAPASLKDISRNKLKDVIKNTFDLNTLKKWLDIETRSDVRLDIMKQLSGLEKKPEGEFI